MGFSWAYIDCGTNLVQGPGGETGSIQFRDGDFTITGSPRLVWDTGTADPADIHNLHVSGNVHVSGTIFAYSYNVNETIRSTTHLNISGASQFGDSFDDVHQFTGSLRVSGAFQDEAHNVNGMALFVTANADMGLVGINTNPTTSPNNRHAKAALTVVAKGATFPTVDSGPAQLRLSGSGLNSSFDFVVDDDKVMTIVPSGRHNGHTTFSSSDDSSGPLIVKTDNTDPVFKAQAGAGPGMAAVSIGYASSSTQGLRVSGAVSSSLGLNIKGTAEFSHPTSIETTGSVIVKHIISCSADLANNINTNLGGAVQFTNAGTSIQTSGAISASKGIVVGGLGIFTLGDGVSDAIHASGNVIVGGILSGSELGNTGKGGQFLGTQYFTKEGTSIETSGAISSSGGVTVGGELILAGPVNFVSGAIITKALISSSAPLNIGGTSIFSNPESLLLSGTLISKGLISSSAGPTMGGTGIFSHPDTSLLLSGTLSSSGGATFLGDMFVNDSNVSGTLTVGTSTVIITSTNISATAGMTLGGAAVFTNNQNANPNSIITSGSISSSLGSLIIGGGTTLSNTVNISGTTTTAGTISSSAGAVFLGTVIADTIQASSSIMSAGSFTISGAISSSGEGAFHSLKSQDGATITGSTTLHGALSSSYGATFTETVVLSSATAIESSGTISSSAGAVFLGTVIANTIQASSSIMSAGALTVSGTISSSAEGGFHSLKVETATSLTGTVNLHGPVTIANGTLSSSSPIVIGGTAVFSTNTNTAPNSILASGSVGIKTNSPTSLLSVSGNIGVSSSANTTYVNFTETDGSDGIGIRVTAGTMQFKNIGGSWTAMGSGGGVGLSDDNAWTGKNAFSGSAHQILSTAHFTNTGTSIQVSGNILPGADNTSDLGSAAKRWANLYTGDLHLKNDRGDWTIIEEEDYLSLRNNKTGKLFKFVLQEIE